MTSKGLRAVFAGACLSAMLIPSALAGPAADKAAESEKLLAAGKPVQAYQAINEAVDAIWDKMPLTIGKALFVIGTPAGYGSYNPRENARFGPKDKMVIYVEPLGFGHRLVNGIYEIDLTAGLVIKDASGKVVAKRDSFGEFKTRSRKKNREFFLKLTISLTGAPKGDYTLVVPVKDNVKGGQAQFSLPFTLVK